MLNFIQKGGKEVWVASGCLNPDGANGKTGPFYTLYRSKTMKKLAVIVIVLLVLFSVFGFRLNPVYGREIKKELLFIKNVGQIADKSVKYYTKFKNGYAFFSENYFGFSIYRDNKIFVYRVYIDGNLIVKDKTNQIYNFLLGNTRYINVPSFKTLYYKCDGYKITFLKNKRFKWNIVASDISKVKLLYSIGNGKIFVDKDKLIILWREGKITEEIPCSYHNKDRVNIKYKRIDNNIIGFDGEIKGEVLIDPATFLGGEGDDIIYSMYKYGDYIYVVGYTKSNNFPTTPGVYSINYKGNQDGFVSKFYKTLSTLVASTYLGGSGEDGINSIFINSSGVFVAGYTKSNDFPITYGAKSGGEDAFVVRLNHSLTTIESSRVIGGTNNERATSVFVHNGYVYIGGDTYSTDFPTTVGAYDNSYNGISGFWGMDVFISKFDIDLSTLVASTYLGGSSYDASYPIYVADDGVYMGGFTYSSNFPTTAGSYDTSFNFGYDGFISKLNLDLSNLASSTFLGGSGNDYIFNLKVYNNNVYVCGGTYSTDFPTTPGAYDDSYNGSATSWGFGGDGFVSSLNSDLSTLLASTYIGGGSDDHFASLFLFKGSVFLVGRSWSSDFPVTSGAYDTTQNGGEDAIVVKFDLTLTDLENSTFLGGSSDERGSAVFVDDKVYIAGYTYSSDFPVTLDAYDTSYNGGSTPGANNYNNYGGGDGFVATLDLKLSDIEVKGVEVGGEIIPVNKFKLISLFVLLYLFLPSFLVYILLRFIFTKKT